MRKVLLLLLFIFWGAKAFALNIVYPKTNPVKINANSTFFIGSTKPNSKLKINDIDVKVSSSGAFAQTVQLNVGTNNFNIVSDNDVVNFVIERAQPSAAPQKTSELIDYPAKINFGVIKDGTPLRMTPVDGGINRMAHLSEGVQLQINGEKGDFYRVYLNSKLSGWIAKSDVEVQPNQSLGLQSRAGLLSRRHQISDVIILKEVKTKEDKEFLYWEFDLGGKIPYVLKEENGLSLQLFNIVGCDDNTYSLNIPSTKLIGYDIYYDKDKLVLKVRKPLTINPEKQLNDLVIAIDAGHGGCEFGAIGGCGDKEKDINLSIAKELQKELECRGAKVIMTRENDEDVSLRDRVKIAKEKNATLLISIHANALPDGADPVRNRGTSVYYYHNQAKLLAENILNSMTTQLGTQNDKVRQGSLALVRPTSSVSVLVEVAYIINPDDYALLLDKDFQIKCAKSIADGIEKYLQN